MSYIFLTSTAIHQDYAHTLADHLLTAGYDVWLDSHDTDQDVSFRAIDLCAACLVIDARSITIGSTLSGKFEHAWRAGKPTYEVIIHQNEVPTNRFRVGQHWEINVLSGQLPDDDVYTRFDHYLPRGTAPGRRIGETVQGTVPKILTPPNVSTIVPPPFGWCHIPAGEIIVNYERIDLQIKPDRFYTPAFIIAQYPITNQQFQVFLDDPQGYQNPAWWENFPGEGPWHGDMKPAFEGDDLPRTMVNWYDAIAFCLWLSAQLGTGSGGRITLPTEFQWQRAAQGDDHRPYPWGDAFDPTRCNFHSDGLVPVTQHQQGTSPFGVMDMTGNASEWTLTNPEGTHDLRDHRRLSVVMGGSFVRDDPDTLRTDYRHRGGTGNAYETRGFRIAYVMD